MKIEKFIYSVLISFVIFILFIFISYINIEFAVPLLFIMILAYIVLVIKYRGTKYFRRIFISFITLLIIFILFIYFAKISLFNLSF